MSVPTPRSAARAPARTDWWWIFDPRLSLRARALVFVGGPAIAFVVLVTWLSGEGLRRQIENQAGRGFESMALQVSDKIDRTLYERLEQLQFLAALGPFRTAEATAADRRRALESTLDSAREFAWLGFAEPAGQIRVATQGLLEGTSIAARPWFRGARERAYVGSVHEFPDLATRVHAADGEGPLRFIDFAVPALSARGEFLGLLLGHVRWPGWARDIQFSVLPESATRDRVGVTIYDANGDVLLDSGGSGWTEPPAAPSVPARKGQLLEPTTGGTSYVTGYVRSRGFRDFRGFGWLIVVRQPVENVYAPVGELRRSIVRWSLVVLALVLTSTWFAAGYIARRLAVMTAAAHLIREGDILSTMPTPTDDSELSRLTGALGEMVEELRSRERPSAEPPASAKRPW